MNSSEDEEIKSSEDEEESHNTKDVKNVRGRSLIGRKGDSQENERDDEIKSR